MAQSRAIRSAPVGYLVLGGLLCVYAVSTLVRPHAGPNSLLDQWAVDVIQLGASVLCLANAARPGPGRLVSLVLGGGMLLWSIGDVVWAAAAVSGTVPPTPSPADAFFLVFY